MATTLIILQLLIVFGFIFIGARVGGIGMGIYGMVGTFLLVFVFGLAPGKAPIDVMMIIVSVIVAASALQATGGLDYLVGVTGKFLRKHPSQITYYGPLACWIFCRWQERRTPVIHCSPSFLRLPRPTKLDPKDR